MPITNAQKKIIHTIVHAIGMPDEDYRHLLKKWFNVDTCLKLNYREAEIFIQRLKYIAERMGKWQPMEQRRKKFDEYGDREGFASPKQLRMIDAMWKEVSYQNDDASKERSLAKLLLNLFQVSHLRFLEDWQARKLIRILQQMKDNPAKHHKHHYYRRATI